jgi:hypothetical protein
MPPLRPRLVPIKAADDWSSKEIKSNRMRIGDQATWETRTAGQDRLLMLLE